MKPRSFLALGLLAAMVLASCAPAEAPAPAQPEVPAEPAAPMTEEPPAPEPELTAMAKEAGKCVESKDYMKSSHMELLNTWRDEAIREGKRTYTASDGKTYRVSLQNTCLECHANKTKFCDQCHNYAEVTPYCWDCHLVPKEKQYGS